MKSRIQSVAVLALASVALMQPPAAAQSIRPKLHVNTRWKQCSIQLDPSLTQAAWRQFTGEAGLVTYFRPLSDARPMGKGTFEVSVLQWQTGINDRDAAWNDTFVHPDSTHWLFEGSGLSFPGLMVRAGLTSHTDMGVYLTKNFGANYGAYGAQLQQNLIQQATTGWSAAARVSVVSLYGPADVNLAVYGADIIASRALALSRWATVSPYVGLSSYLSSSHEKSAVVNLRDERVVGGQGTVGVIAQLSMARVGAEYNFAKVSSFSLKVGLSR